MATTALYEYSRYDKIILIVYIPIQKTIRAMKVHVAINAGEN